MATLAHGPRRGTSSTPSVELQQAVPANPFPLMALSRLVLAVSKLSGNSLRNYPELSALPYAISFAHEPIVAKVLRVTR